jgi:hypothetical protein
VPHFAPDRRHKIHLPAVGVRDFYIVNPTTENLLHVYSVKRPCALKLDGQAFHADALRHITAKRNRRDLPITDVRRREIVWARRVKCHGRGGLAANLECDALRLLSVRNWDALKAEVMRPYRNRVGRNRERHIDSESRSVV